MKRSRYTEEQISDVLREAEAGAKAADLARRHGVSAGNALQLEVQVWRAGGVGGQAIAGA